MGFNIILTKIPFSFKSADKFRHNNLIAERKNNTHTLQRREQSLSTTFGQDLFPLIHLQHIDLSKVERKKYSLIYIHKTSQLYIKYLKIINRIHSFTFLL